MKNIKSSRLAIVVLIPVLIVISAFLSSCKGPAGPLGEPGLITMSFQDGLYPANTYAGTTMTYIESGLYEYTAFYGNDTAPIGSASGYKYRALIKFDLSSAVVPAGVTVHNAYLTITLGSATDNTINVYPITAPWVEVETTWMNYTNASLWATPGGDHGAVMDSKICNATSLTFTLNPVLVTSWIQSPAANNGLILIATDEASGAYANMYAGTYVVQAQRPKLTIYYSLP